MAIIKIKNPAIDLDAAEIPNLPASKITSGTLDNARISLDAAEIPNLDTAKITTGTFATARLADSSVSLAKLTATGTKDTTTFLRGDNTFDTPPLDGITGEDQWRISATAFFTGSGDITANWERGDTDSQGYIGSAMTQSSGVFTFPSTGIWLVMAQMSLRPDGVRTYVGGQIYVTTNNSSYSAASEISQHSTSGNNYVACYFHHILDVTDTSNVKVKLRYDSNGSGDVIGSSTAHTTGMSFIRLGDT